MNNSRAKIFPSGTIHCNFAEFFFNGLSVRIDGKLYIIQIHISYNAIVSRTTTKPFKTQYYKPNV